MKPRAYYNEFDPFAAEWLRNLIARGHIMAGDVDTRSIVEVRPDDLRGYTRVHFFAGIGGWDYALQLAGWPDTRPVWTGSCPCQPFSAAGKRKGTADERHLWPDFFRLIRECRPERVFGEQVANALGHHWLDGVCTDLEAEAYRVGAVVLGAHSVGAPHIRQRLWWVADAGGERCNGEPVRLFGRESRQPGSEATGGGAGGGLADAGHAQRGPLHIGDEQYGPNAGWAQAHGQSGARREVRGLADSQGHGLSREQAAWKWGAGTSHNGGLGNADDEGPQGRQRRSLRVPDPQGRQAAERSLGLSGVAGPWSDAIWLPCLDGKARCLKPGIEPLAYGVSGRVAVRRTVLQAGAEVSEAEHWYSRVGALRGAGNAIVPQVAAEFITAYRESE